MWFYSFLSAYSTLAFHRTSHENAATLNPWPQYHGPVTAQPPLLVEATPTNLPLTFFLHAGPEAFVEPAETTLVPLILVHNALPAEPAQTQRVVMQRQGEKRVKGTERILHALILLVGAQVGLYLQV